MISHNQDVGHEPEAALKVRVDAPSATLMLNRPDKCNALSRHLLDALGQSLDDLRQERRVRAVILTGARQVFSSGTDLAELHATNQEEHPQSQWFADVSRLRELLDKMMQFPKPIIAAVNGPVWAAGVGLTLAADLVVGCADATFGLPEVRRGLVAGIVAPLLALRLGASQATHLLMRGHSISADDAHRMGLIHELVAAELTWARSHELAKELAESSADALAMTKRLLYDTVGEQLSTLMSAGAAVSASARTTEAGVEGVTAFVEKRTPQWP